MNPVAARATRGLQGAPLLPSAPLRPNCRATGAPWGIRRWWSNLKPRNTEATKPAPTIRRVKYAYVRGTPDPNAPFVQQIGGTSTEDTEGRDRVHREVGNRPLIRYHIKRDAPPIKTDAAPAAAVESGSPPDGPSPSGRPKTFTKTGAVAKPRVLYFAGLTPGTTVSHVVNAIRRLAEKGTITWKTALVTDASSRPDGSVRVAFFYSEGALETFHLARIGGIRIAGPTGVGVLPRVRVSAEEVDAKAIGEGGGRLGAFDPALYRQFVRETVDKERLVRRTHLNYNRELPVYPDEEERSGRAAASPHREVYVPPLEGAGSSIKDYE